MSFLGGAECSTVGNPLTQFTKHVQDDKSLQRDRLVGMGPGAMSEGMRSQAMMGGQDQVRSKQGLARIKANKQANRAIIDDGRIHAATTGANTFTAVCNGAVEKGVGTIPDRASPDGGRHVQLGCRVCSR